MTWLTRLEKRELPPVGIPTKPTEGAFVGFVGARLDLLQEIVFGKDTLQTRLKAKDLKPAALFPALRDEQVDDRPLCLKCLHLSGGVSSTR